MKGVARRGSEGTIVEVGAEVRVKEMGVLGVDGGGTLFNPSLIRGRTDRAQEGGRGWVGQST